VPLTIRAPAAQKVDQDAMGTVNSDAAWSGTLIPGDVVALGPRCAT
jgi:hypothetical protein